MSLPQSAKSENVVRTRILVLSDTHTQTPKPPDDPYHAYREPLPSADLLLHAGDITKVGRMTEYRTMVEMIKRHPAELKLVIAGNHDITLDPQYYDSQHGRSKHEGEDIEAVRDLWTGEDAKKHGLVYLEEGTAKFELKNGAKFTIYSSPYQPEFCNWAFAYPREQDRFNPPPASSSSSPLSALLLGSQPGTAPSVNPVPSHPAIDIMLTHGPPRDILDQAWRGGNVGCDHLLTAVRRTRPLLHCFGHIHEGWGAVRVDWTAKEKTEVVEVNRSKAVEDRCAYLDVSSAGTGNDSDSDGSKPVRHGQETLFVNAAIMDVMYRPTNAPWLIDIDLPMR